MSVSFSKGHLSCQYILLCKYHVISRVAPGILACCKVPSQAALAVYQDIDKTKSLSHVLDERSGVGEAKHHLM